MKVSRYVMMFKAIGRQLRLYMHPRSVHRIRLEGKDVDDDTLRAVTVYFFAGMVIVLASMLVLALENLDLVTTFTAVAATFNNIGPGLGGVGPTSNFSAFSDLSKCVMIFDMLAGRLEVFPMLLLFYPPLWRETVSQVRRGKHRAIKRT